MLEVVMVGSDVQRLAGDTGPSDLLDEALSRAEQIERDWDVLIAGDLLDAIERAARESVDQAHGVLWRALAWGYGIRGQGTERRVRELSHAANRAALWRRDANTVFVFRDPALAAAVPKGGGPRVCERRTRGEMVAVLVSPGQTRPWPRRRSPASR
jgi:hypothetical protein